MARELTYAEAYEKGWRSSAGLGPIDLTERESRFTARYGHAREDAWMDGYLDYAAGREKWHLRDCPDHDNCGQGRVRRGRAQRARRR
jgi:hypothetical protein